jgi:hypothetical protein
MFTQAANFEFNKDRAILLASGSFRAVTRMTTLSVTHPPSVKQRENGQTPKKESQTISPFSPLVGPLLAT